MKYKILTMFLVLFLLGCKSNVQTQPQEPAKQATPSEPVNVTKPECTKNSDCFPATCCHPDDCVPIGKEPSCFNAVCTDECKQVSMDCGQGKCECIDEKCTAVIYS